MSSGSYSVSDIQDYFECIGEETYNPSIKVYVNKIENRITFKVKAWYYLKLLSLTPETIKLLGRTISKMTKNENGENVPI